MVSLRGLRRGSSSFVGRGGGDEQEGKEAKLRGDAMNGHTMMIVMMTTD